jgi:hypothetical protein
VHGIGFGGKNDLAAGAEVLQGRQGDLGGLGARFGEQLDRRVERFDLLGIAGDIPGVEMPDDADPQAFDALAEHRPVVSDRLVGASGVAPIMPGDHLEHERVVAHRARHRADIVERRRAARRPGGSPCHRSASCP